MALLPPASFLAIQVGGRTGAIVGPSQLADAIAAELSSSLLVRSITIEGPATAAWVPGFLTYTYRGSLVVQTRQLFADADAVIDLVRAAITDQAGQAPSEVTYQVLDTVDGNATRPSADPSLLPTNPLSGIGDFLMRLERDAGIAIVLVIALVALIVFSPLARNTKLTGVV